MYNQTFVRGKASKTRPMSKQVSGGLCKFNILSVPSTNNIRMARAQIMKNKNNKAYQQLHQSVQLFERHLSQENLVSSTPDDQFFFAKPAHGSAYLPGGKSKPTSRMIASTDKLRPATHHSNRPNIEQVYDFDRNLHKQKLLASSDGSLKQIISK